MINFKNKTGFTLVEILVVIGIIALLSALTFPLFRNFQKQTDLIDSAEKIVSALRLAQYKTLASDQDDQWGVFFSTSTSLNQYVLFKGQNYQSRDASFDTVYQLTKLVEIQEINLNQSSEVVFNPVIGSTDQFGDILIRLKNNHQKTSLIYVKPLGQVGVTESAIVSDLDRIKDSRVVYFNYDRLIVPTIYELSILRNRVLELEQQIATLTKGK